MNTRSFCYQVKNWRVFVAMFARRLMPAVSALNHNLGLNCCSNGVWRIGHLLTASPPDARCDGGVYAFRQVNSFAGMDKMW